MKGIVGALGVAAFGAALFGLVALLIFGVSACNNWKRGQAVKDAKNRVRINHVKIMYFEQQKQIEHQKADIRVIHAVGIRKSQDEIAKTLTPLYVSFEMTQALEQIASSGRNNSVVFVPTDPKTGLSIVPGLTDKVGR